MAYIYLTVLFFKYCRVCGNATDFPCEFVPERHAGAGWSQMLLLQAERDDAVIYWPERAFQALRQRRVRTKRTIGPKSKGINGVLKSQLNYNPGLKRRRETGWSAKAKPRRQRALIRCKQIRLHNNWNMVPKNKGRKCKPGQDMQD